VSWLPSLKTAPLEEWLQLAIKLSRTAVKLTQPDDDVRGRMRDEYANKADSFTMASQVVALSFQPVSQANDYWT